MKIATWNLERLDKNKNHLILAKLIEVNADILVLTETNSIISLNNYVCISTENLPPEFDSVKYKPGENRTSIWTKYKVITKWQTYDNFTNVCAEIESPFGILTVYGTIIGVFAHKQPRFDIDLKGNLEDFEKYFSGRQVCIAGDFNVMFSGFAYPSRKARKTLNDSFKKYNLINTTASIEKNIDHIVLSNNLLEGRKTIIETWNQDKKLSDHIGLCLTLNEDL